MINNWKKFNIIQESTYKSQFSDFNSWKQNKRQQQQQILDETEDIHNNILDTFKYYLKDSAIDIGTFEKVTEVDNVLNIEIMFNIYPNFNKTFKHGRDGRNVKYGDKNLQQLLKILTTTFMELLDTHPELSFKFITTKVMEIYKSQNAKEAYYSYSIDIKKLTNKK